MARRELPDPARTRDVEVDGARVCLVGTIQGLAGESEHVTKAWSDAFGDHGPDAVALGFPPEDVTNLKRIHNEGVEAFMDQDFDTGSYEDSVLPQLARFGDIAVPPDDLVELERLALDANIEPVAVDLDDDAHADLFVKEVSGLQMIRGQMRLRKLQGGALEKARSAEELMLMWDAAFTSIAAYRRIERAREQAMVRGIRDIAADHARILALVPYPRLDGVARALAEPSEEATAEPEA